MNTLPVKSKWKPWHKKVLAGCAIIVIFIFFISDKEAISTAPANPAADRIALIEKAFDQWDGSHRQLAKMVKENMNDASSFKAIDTKYYDHDSLITVVMEYSGKNAYNATVKAIITADCSIDGTVLKIK